MPPAAFLVGLLSGLYHSAAYFCSLFGARYGASSQFADILCFSYAVVLWPLCPLQHIAYAIIACHRWKTVGLVALFIHYAGALWILVGLEGGNGGSGHRWQHWLTQTDGWHLARSLTPFFLLNLWYLRRLVRPLTPDPTAPL